MTSIGYDDFWKQVTSAMTENEEVFGPVKKTNKKPEQTGLWWDTVGMDGYVKSVQSLLAQIQKAWDRGQDKLPMPQPDVTADPWPTHLRAVINLHENVCLSLRAGGKINQISEDHIDGNRQAMRSWSPDDARAILEQLQVVAQMLETRANEREARSRALIEEHAKQTASIDWLKGQVAGQHLADLES